MTFCNVSILFLHNLLCLFVIVDGVFHSSVLFNVGVGEVSLKYSCIILLAGLDMSDTQKISKFILTMFNIFRSFVDGVNLKSRFMIARSFS